MDYLNTAASYVMTYLPPALVLASAAAAALPRPTKPGLPMFFRQILDAAAFNFGNAKNAAMTPSAVQIKDVKLGVSVLISHLPQIKKALDERFSNTTDDLVLVSDLAKDLAPQISNAAIVARGADLALMLSKLGLIK